MRAILLIGGTGFVGSALADELARRYPEAELRLPTRTPERCKALTVLPNANLFAADVHDPATLARLAAGCEAVINLVGILHGDEPAPGMPYGTDFARAHVALPGKIAVAARDAGARRLVHVSSLGAASAAPSAYLRSKAAGEAALRAVDADWTIVRPSVIFGRGDAFLTLFARLAGLAPVLPLAGAATRFQPVWVGDVAATLADCIERPEAAGQTYELGGPRVYTLRDLVAYAARLAGHRPLILPLAEPWAWLQARTLELLPEPPLTRDNLRSLRIDSVCAPGTTLPFGRVATALEAVAPGYLAS